MTALAADRAGSREKWGSIDFTLTSGTKAYKNAKIGLDITTGKVKPMVAGSTLLFIGYANRQVDATAAEKQLSVRLHDEISAEWLVNSGGGDAVTATDIGKVCYSYDDQTVGIVPLGRQVAGVSLKLSTVEGVLVMALPYAMQVPGHVAALAALGAFAAGDLVVAAGALVHGAVYDLPTTAAVSTVTLPAAAPDGMRVTIVADGTKNGHTVQYRDATGPVNLTTALLASKRHEVIAVKRDGAWYANAYTAP
jgi:hypothetical protein